MKLLVINGPNLNMLGIREPEIYGKKTYQDLCDMINKYAEDKKISVDIYQSNHEGSIVDCIQQAYFDKVDGIIINPGAYLEAIDWFIGLISEGEHDDYKN